MKGAIFYSGQYGSTAQYADWIAEATGLPAFSIHDSYADPSQYDFLVLGSSVIVFELTIREWVAKHLAQLMDMLIVLYSVSGAPPGPKVKRWIQTSLPNAFVAHVNHVALQGRLDRDSLPWWTRLTLRIGAMMNANKQAKQDELRGFDYMDKTSIAPIVAYVHEIQNPPLPAAEAA